MPYPDVSPTTERLYSRLAEVRRDADADQADTGTGYPLLRYLSLIGDQAGDRETLIDRLPTDLTDPDLADAAWLPWLAQLRGATLPATLPEADRRTTIRYAASGFRAGSRDALEAVAARALIGSRFVEVVPNLDGDPWVIGLHTIEAETPDLAAVVQAITDAAAKPAGYRLDVTFYSASWDTLEAAYPTSDDWDAVATSAELEATH